MFILLYGRCDVRVNNTAKKTYTMDMCSGPVLKNMLVFSLPLMLSSILQLLFNAADVIVVGHFAGGSSLAAVGSNSPLINLLTNLFLGLSVGSNVVAARLFGAYREDELSEVTHTSMLLGLLSGLFLTAVGLIGARQILIWMKTPPKVLELAALYLRIYFLGMTATMVYNFGSAILRAVGDTRRPLYFLLLAGVINVVLNLFFVIVMRLDVAGVAIATVISQCVSAALVVRCLMRESGGIRFVPKNMRIYKDKLSQILKIGIPAGMQGTLFSISNVVIQASVNTFGETVMAGSSAAANIEQFVYRILAAGQLCAILAGLVLGNVVVVFGHTLVGIYSPSEPIIQAGMARLSVICTTYALCGMMDVMVGALRGIGYSIMPMIVSLLGACGLRLALIATLFTLPAFHTITVLYMTYPVSWLVTFAVHVVCFVWAAKKQGVPLGLRQPLTD